MAGYYQNNIGALYTYPYLLSSGLKIMVYSGNGRCSTVRSREWIASLDLEMLQDPSQWYLAGQVAGIVKGVGHVVPLWAPPQAHSLLYHFLFDVSWRTLSFNTNKDMGKQLCIVSLMSEFCMLRNARKSVCICP